MSEDEERELVGRLQTNSYDSANVQTGDYADVDASGEQVLLCCTKLTLSIGVLATPQNELLLGFSIGDSELEL